MSTLRDHCTDMQLAAHAVLDSVRAGARASGGAIDGALAALGETGEWL